MHLLRKLAAATAATALVLTGSATVTNAAPPKSIEITAEQRQGLIDQMNTYGVPLDKQEALLVKFQSGATLDSFAKNKVPVSSETTTTNTKTVKIDRFADNSWKAVTQTPDRATTPSAPVNQPPAYGVDNCTVISGGRSVTYQNCTVSAAWLGITIAFVATAYVNYDSYYDGIGDLRGTTQKCWVVSCSTPSYTYQKLNEDSSGPATVQATSSVSGPNGSWDVWVQLKVGGDRYWSENS